MKLSKRIRIPHGGLAGTLAAAMALALAVPHAASAPAPLSAAAPAAATSSAALTTTQASAQAKTTGKAVLAGAMTTSTREVTANPNGTFTMTISPVPVRVEHHGSWVPLNATLHANANGTVSPAAVPGALTLSGGGTTALATMTSVGRQLSVTLPATLPKPALSGDTATYANVLPGTDLVVTATAQGGFSDVFVVKTPAAAADPRLAALLNAHITGSAGLQLHTDAAGDFSAAAPDGNSVFTAPPAAAWDSSTSASKPTNAATAKNTAKPTLLIPTDSHTSLASTATGPGRYAHQASLGATLHTGTLTLTPPPALKAASAEDFPLYYDPQYGPAVANFATVNSAFTGQPYINGSGTSGYMQVGYNGNLEGCNPCFNARSFVTLNMSGLPAGATNISAQVNFWDSWSASCTAEELDLWTTGPVITSGSNETTWAHQPSWNSQVQPGQTVSKGWLTGCSSGGIGWTISSQVQSVVNAHGTTLTLGLRIPANQESSNDDNWKQLNGNNSNQTETTASVTYDVKPNTPTGLKTSPYTNCSSTSPTILGDTGVTLYAPVSTTTKANLTTTFDFYKTSAPTVPLLTTQNGIASDTYTGASGQPAVMVLPESFIKTQSGSSPTTFAWTATTFDGTLHSDPSSACTFEIDNSRPGSPGVAPAATPPAGINDCPLVPTAATEPVGTSCAFTFTPPVGTTSVSGYTYQVNDAKPTEVNVTKFNLTGEITVEFNLPGIVNTLTVSALSAGGNVGSATTVWFDGTTYDPPETDGDLTGDTIPDLIVPGNTTGAFPPGLWLAQGQRNGSVNTYPQNIGTAGLYSGTATDWNGAEAISGNFCGLGTQDALAYFPGALDATSNPNGGGGAIICGTGTTQPLQEPVSGNQYSFGQNSFSYTDSNSNLYNASTVANGGVYASADNQISYQLFYAAIPTGTSSGVLSVFAETEPNVVTNMNLAIPQTPDNGTDWNNWTVTTAQDTRGGQTYTDMYLWDSATGDLYLWAGMTLNSTSLDAATALSYTPYQIASNWNTGATLTLRAADIAGDGNPGLWATNTATGQTTAYVPPATLAAKPTLASPPSNKLNTATHSWQFTDIPSATSSGTEITSTADGDGTMNLTKTSGTNVSTGADWNTGDLYSPDVRFTGTNGFLTTASNPLDLTQSFTVSLWTKPETDGTMALSESGSAYPGLMIYPDGTGWSFYLAKDNGTTAWGGDSVIGGNIDYGVWTHLQATYDANTHVMNLYVDDTLVATGTHAVPSGTATGPLVLGSNIANGALTSFYTGQIADVQTWSGTPLAPDQPASPASYHQAITPERILDTRQTTTNKYSGIVENNTPIAANSTIAVPIVGDTVTPIAPGAPTTIPATATAVAVDVTATSETAAGIITTYADGTQRPITSSTNYGSSDTVTGYQIVPLGADGKIDLYNGSTGTTHVLVDVTGYYTSDATLAGDQTYHPLTTAYRALDTNNSTPSSTDAGISNTNNTLTATGPVAKNTTFTLQITNVDGIPSTATAVAINLTAFGQSGGGVLDAYQDGTGIPTTSDTSLTYTGTQTASMAADVSLSAAGRIDISNIGTSSTDIIGDISGYYTTDTSGQAYHSVNPTRLADTRSGIGGTTGATAAKGTYALTDTAQITTATNPTLALMLTATDETAIGAAIAYPTSSIQPNTSNLNWVANQAIANLALTPANSSGAISIYNESTGTTQLVIDCSGYFANDAQDAPNHAWPLANNSGTTAADTVGTTPLTLYGGSTWTTSTVGGQSSTNVLALDGTTGYGATSGPAINTAGGFTVSAWANLSSIPTSNATITAQSGTQAAGFYLQYNSYYKSWCMTFMTSDTANANGYSTQACSGTAPTASTLYHLTGTYDPASHTSALYVNGILAGTSTSITNWNATGALTIGAAQYNAALTDHFPGNISNVETFNYPLSATQATQLYQQLN